MKKSLLALSLGCVLASTVQAASVDPNAPADNWRRFSSSDRLAYATRASVACLSSNCGSIEIRACMDEVVRPPAPKAVQSITIGELAVGCIATLKSQR